MKRLTAILDEPPELVSGRLSPMTLSGRLEFRGVDFSYSGNGNGDRVLKDIDLSIEPGQTVAFVGRTGAGKTTLTRAGLEAIRRDQGLSAHRRVRCARAAGGVGA